MWEGSTNTHSCPCITMYMCNTLRWGSQYHTQHTYMLNSVIWGGDRKFVINSTNQYKDFLFQEFNSTKLFFSSKIACCKWYCNLHHY